MLSAYFSSFVLLLLSPGLAVGKGIDVCEQNQFPELAKLREVKTSMGQKKSGVPPRKQLTLTIKGDLRNTQEVINCIAYPFCGNQVQTLSGDLNGALKMTVDLELTDEEMNQIPALCPWKKFQAEIEFKSKSGNDTLFTDLKKLKSDSSLQTEFLKTRVPAVLVEISASDRKEAVKTADRQIEVKHFERASQTLMKAFQFSMKPYLLKFVKGKFNGCVTKPTDLTVTCSLPENACDLMMTLRHEAEHIQQFARRDYCLNQETGSLFDSHVARERSAYLNDVVNSENYCPRAWIKLIKENSVQNVTQRYFKNQNASN